MGDTQPPLPSVISDLCYRFHAAWAAGGTPRIEEFLGCLSGDAQAVAFRALLPIELDFLRRRGQAVSEDEYRHRFPHFSETISQQVYATVPPSPGPAAPGKTATLQLPGYEVLEEIGRGGMGVVFKARDVELQRLVAIKMILHADLAGERERERFLAEARAAARLEHPGIVHIHHVGTHEGRPFLVMEFVEGGSLAGKLRGQPVPARQAASIVARLARAVQAAHEARIVHRDLKPANVLVTPRWDLKIADFGLARKLDEPGLTGTGAVVGTPSYMAPEQARGDKDLGPAADIYALGAILYQLLTGQPPFVGQAVMELLQAVIHQEPVRPGKRNPAVPAALETICLKCLEKEPARRYASAADLADDLERFGREEPIHARPVGPLARLWRSARRRPAVPILAGLGVIALLSLVVGSYFAWRASGFRGGMESAQAAAEQERQKRLEKEAEDAQRRDRERRQDEAARRRTFRANLLRARVLWQADPAAGRALLDDARAFPEALRDDDWRLLQRLCSRDPRGTLAEPGDCRWLLSSSSHSAPSGLALSPESQVLAVARPVQGRGTGKVGPPEVEVRLVALDSGRPLRLLGRFPSNTQVPRLAFAPGGKLLALVVPPRSGGKEGWSVRLFDVPSGKPRQTIAVPAGDVGQIAFSPDGRGLAVATSEPAPPGEKPPAEGPRRISLPRLVVTLYDVPGGTQRARLEGQEGHLLALAVAAGGNSLALAGHRLDEAGKLQARVDVWDVAKRQVVFSQKKDRFVLAGAVLALSHDGKYLALSVEGGRKGFVQSGQVALWDVPAQRRERSLTWKVDFRKLPGGNFGGGVSQLRFSPDGKALAVGLAAGAVHLFDTGTGQGRSLAGQHAGRIDVLEFTADGGELYSGGMFTRPAAGRASLPALRRHEVRTGKEKAVLAPPSRVLAVVVSPDGKTLAAGTAEQDEAGARGMVVLHDLASGRRLASWKAHDGAVVALTFAADGKMLATAGGLEGRLPVRVRAGVKFWRLGERGAPGTQIDWPFVGAIWREVTALAFEPGGKRLAVAGEGQVRLWDVETRKITTLVKPAAAPFTQPEVYHAIAFSPDGRLLALGGRPAEARVGQGHDGPPTGEVHLVDARSGEKLGTIEGHAGPVYWLAFGDDGRSLASAALVDKGDRFEVEVRISNTSDAHERASRRRPPDS